MDAIPEYRNRWIAAEELKGLETKLSQARRWNWALAIIAACGVVYAAAANYQWKKTASFAERSNAVGYLSAQADVLTGQASAPSVAQVNAGIMKWRATSKELGYRNPDTLRYYKIKPWEDY